MRLLKSKKVQSILIFLLFTLFAIYSNLPILQRSLYTVGTDLPFHINRIVGLAEQLTLGNFSPNINTAFLDGFGYPVDLFYGNITILPASILVALGLNVITTLRIFSIFVSFLTLYTMYFASKRITKNNVASIISALLYLFSNYRLRDYFYRGGVGSWISFIFIPLIFLGMYEVIKGDFKKWYILVIGFIGVFLSHVLSAVTVTLVLIPFVLFNYKAFLKNSKRFTRLILSGISILMLTMYYWLPLLEQMSSYEYFGKNNPVFNISTSGNYPFFEIFSMSLNNEIVIPYILSASLVIVIISRIFINKVKFDEIQLMEGELALADMLTLTSIFLVFLSSSNFPWVVFEKYLNILQFSHRFLPFVILFLSLSGGIYFYYYYSHSKNKFRFTILAFILLSLVPLNQLISYKNNATFFNLQTYDIGVGKEYLPIDTDIEILKNSEKSPEILSGDAQIKKYKKKGSEIVVSISTNSDTVVQLPLIYYNGYSIQNELSEKIIPIPGDNHLITFKANKSGIYTIKYTGTTIKRVTSFVSLISLLFFILFIGYSIFTKSIKKK